MNIFLYILLGILISFFIIFTKKLSADETGFSKEDERQKRILTDATRTSWQVIMIYALFRLINIIPIFQEFVGSSQTKSNTFFNNGGDIFLVCLIGYTIGASISYFRHS
ncbi:hypothetical protein [Bacillus sp. CDB3]|uniref:hypothetical protein n=1 Tax=Bacillus sp. CDB3 TaxID=360310 RepID=UPI0009D7D5FF|nr:hypothetical protein [Bacillus sp. CDB3]OQR53411.1 hypothetical protein CDB3_29955 [Bacillus sp. CDB3]